jgi:hypothetical protein
MAVEEVVVIPAGHPNMMQGDVERFDEAVQRRECPYLNQMGEVALESMREAQAALETGDTDALVAMAAQLAANQAAKEGRPPEVKTQVEATHIEQSPQVPIAVMHEGRALEDEIIRAQAGVFEEAAPEPKQEVVLGVEAAEPKHEVVQEVVASKQAAEFVQQTVIDEGLRARIEQERTEVVEAISELVKPVPEAIAKPIIIPEKTAPIIEEPVPKIVVKVVVAEEVPEVVVQETVVKVEPIVEEVSEPVAVAEIVVEMPETSHVEEAVDGLLGPVESVVEESEVEIPEVELVETVAEVVEQISGMITEELIELRTAILSEITDEIVNAPEAVVSLQEQGMCPKLEELIEELTELLKEAMEPADVRKMITQLRDELIEKIAEEADEWVDDGMHEVLPTHFTPQLAFKQSVHSLLGKLAMLRPAAA